MRSFEVNLDCLTKLSCSLSVVSKMNFRDEMKRYFVILTLIFLLFIGFFSCTEKSLVDSIPSFQEGLIPLKVGFKWTYHSSWYNESGSLTNSFLYNIEVTRDTMISNEKWFILKLDFYGSYLYEIVTNRNGVFYKYDGTTAQLVLNPVIEDTSVINYNTTYLRSKDQNIKVPIGEFSCYQYRGYNNYQGKPIVFGDFYYSFNKGQIKTVYYYLDKNMKLYTSTVLELVSTNIF